MSRRNALQIAASLGVFGTIGPLARADQSSGIKVRKGTVIVFQGDSITDEGRKKNKFFNRGISGNKIPDLVARWDRDAMALKPDILSIMIGVNDLWHTFAFGNKYKATIEDYESGYRALIERTTKELPEVRIVICEPFTTRTAPEFKPLAQFRAVSKKLADEMKLDFVPFQSLFDEAINAAPAEFWLWDGIHPSAAGHSIMANYWREIVGI